MIRTAFQRQVRQLLAQLSPAERASFRRMRTAGLDWADALTFGVILPDISTTLAEFQASGSFTRH